VSDLVRQLEVMLASQPAAPMARSPESLLAGLPTRLATLLRLCAIPHEIDGEILQLLDPGATSAEIAEGLREIAGLAFVTLVGSRMALHDSVRRPLFAAWLDDQAVNGSFRAVSRRLFEHFGGHAGGLTTLSGESLRAQALFHRLAFEQEAAFAEFEHECRVARCQGRLSACASVIGLVHEYDRALTAPQRAALRYHEAKLALDLQRHEEAESLFQALLATPGCPPALAAKARLRLGALFCERREFARALDSYRRAWDIVSAAGQEGVARYDVLRSLGEATRDSGQLEEAEGLLQRSLTEAEAAGDFSAAADSLNSLGTLHKRRGELPDAARAYRRSLDLLERLGRRFQAAQVYNNLGSVHADLGQWEEAELLLQASLAIKRKAGDTVGQGRSLVNLAKVERASHRPHEAREHYLEAQNLFRQVRHLPGQAHASLALATLARSGGQREEAETHFADAALLFDRLGDTEGAAQARRDLDAL
jgi:tetratricopeptide (TPR) repeat protein